MIINQINVDLLNNGRLIVWDIKHSRELYLNRFYGKPLGITKPKYDFEAPLVLDPIESVYLLEKGYVKVYDCKEKKELSLYNLLEYSRRALDKFEEKYRVYKDLRDKGWIVLPGIKYGCDFAVYKEGPGIEHAPYIIQILNFDEKLTASEIVKGGRLATTVRKNFIIAVINDEKVTYLEFEWWRA